MTKQDLSSLQGVKKTAIENVYFYRGGIAVPRQPLLFQSGIFILVQGQKNLFIDDKTITYQGGDHLVVGVPLPIECETVIVNDQYLLGILVEVPNSTLNRLINKLNLDVNDNEYQSKYFGFMHNKMNDEMIDVVTRLAKALCNEKDGIVLGESIVEEIIYRTIKGPAGNLLTNLQNQSSAYSRIADILNKLHRDIAAPIKVSELAKEVNMSETTFYKMFKEVTSESPIQYIKKVRLNKARDLIKNEGLKVSQAANIVGYTSTSQFCRDHKKHFKSSPKKF